MCAPNFLNSQWITVRGLGVKTAARPDRIYEFKHDGNRTYRPPGRPRSTALYPQRE